MTNDVPEQPEQESGNAPEEQSEVETLNAQLKEQQSKYLYLYADFENYKKRAFKERADVLKFGHEGLARELLLVLDNLQRALEHGQTGSAETLLSGLKMVVQQFTDTLSKFGIVPIETIGKRFDPELHEAVGQEPVDGAEEGSIVREAQKGYLLHGRLLRPARVIVAAGLKN